MTTRNDIERVLWKACDSFRGKIDSSRYKDYILSMLFVKYLSDVCTEKREVYTKQYRGDMQRVDRAMRRERFMVDASSTFDYLYDHRNDIQREPGADRGESGRADAGRSSVGHHESADAYDN